MVKIFPYLTLFSLIYTGKIIQHLYHPYLCKILFLALQTVLCYCVNFFKLFIWWTVYSVTSLLLLSIPCPLCPWNVKSSRATKSICNCVILVGNSIPFCPDHRIIDDRIEKNIKGRRIGHCAFAASIFKVQRFHQY